MDHNSDQNQTRPLNPVATTTLRWPPFYRKINLRRRKLPSIRLGGGKKAKPFKSLVLVKVLKKLKVKWTRLRHLCTLKRLKRIYVKMIKEIIEAGAAVESFQHKISAESSFGLPVTGISCSNYPSSYAASYAASLRQAKAPSYTY